MQIRIFQNNIYLLIVYIRADIMQNVEDHRFKLLLPLLSKNAILGFPNFKTYYKRTNQSWL